MADFTTPTSITTPGSAVADTLQNILANKRMEARQNLLDSLNVQNTQSQIADRDANAQTMAEMRKTQEENRKSMAADRDAQAGARFMAGLGDQPADVDPATAAKIRSIAPTRIQSTPGGPTLPSTQFAGAAPIVGAPGATPLPQAAPTDSPSVVSPGTNRYLGSPAYMKQKDTSDKLNAMVSDPSFSNLPPEQQLLKLAPLFPNTDPSSILERLITSKTQAAPGHFRVYDEASGTVKDMGEIGPNDKTTMVPRPPKETTPTVSMVGQTPEGDPLFQTNRLNKDGLPVLMRADGTEYSGKVMAKDSAAQHKPIALSPSESKTIEGLRAKAQPTPGFLWGTNPAPQKRQDAYKAEAKAAVAKIGVSKEVQDAFSDVIDDPVADGFSASQIAAGHTNLSPEDQAALRSVILQVRGK